MPPATPQYRLRQRALSLPGPAHMTSFAPFTLLLAALSLAACATNQPKPAASGCRDACQPNTCPSGTTCVLTSACSMRCEPETLTRPH